MNGGRLDAALFWLLVLSILAVVAVAVWDVSLTTALRLGRLGGE